MDPCNIVYISLDSERQYRRAFYSLLTLLNKHTPPSSPVDVILFTDNPQWFNMFNEHVDIQYISSQTVGNWMDEADGFPLIVKPRILQQLDSNFIFIDSDTTIEQPLTDLMHQLDHEHGILHTPEYVLSSSERYQPYLKGYEAIGISKNTMMWNSGVIGMTKNRISDLPRITDLTLRAFRVFNIHTAEQLAFSHYFQQNGVQLIKASQHICHYWNRKAYMDLRLHQWFSKYTPEQIMKGILS